MTRSGWTTLEEQALAEIAKLGAEHAAAALDKSIHSVKCKASEKHISLRKRVGPINDTRLTPELKDRVKALAIAPICPACGKRPASVKATGLCGTCHYGIVVGAKLEELEIKAAQMRISAIRQQRCRMRICEECGAAFYPRKDSKDTMCEDCR